MQESTSQCHFQPVFPFLISLGKMAVSSSLRGALLLSLSFGNLVAAQVNVPTIVRTVLLLVSPPRCSTFCHMTESVHSCQCLNSCSCRALSFSTSDSDTTLFEPETVQLAGDIIWNLTAIELQDATLFDFGPTNTTSTTLDKRSSSCKVFSGDRQWPFELVWFIFDILLGGNLIATVPSAASCYNDWPVHNATECTYVTDSSTDSYFQ